MRFAPSIAIVSFLMAFTEPALAEVDWFAGKQPVDEPALAAASGMRAWSLTVGDLISLNSDNSMQVAQLIGGTTRIQMDVWWGSTGASLVAQSVRSSGFE